MLQRRVAAVVKGMGSIGRAAAVAAVVSGTGASVLLSADPSRAAIVHWNIKGFLSTNTGPLTKGYFTGFFNWDTTAGSSVTGEQPVYGSVPLTTYTNPALLPGGYTPGTNGTGAFTFWDIKFYTNDPALGGTFVERIHSHDLDFSQPPGPPPATEETAVMSNTLNPESGCFGSPLDKNNGATGTYFESRAGGAVCTGALAFNDKFDTTASVGADLFFAVVQDEPFNYNIGGTLYTFTHTYFRIPIVGDPGDPNGSLAIPGQPPLNPQADEWFGWSLYQYELINELTVTDPFADNETPCTGSNAFPATSPGCPYSGNNQQIQGISGDIIIRQSEIPAPLPIAGAAPLGFMLRKLARKRTHLLASKSGSLPA